ARILEIHIRRRDRDPKTIDCAALAKAADGFSGAEIEHAVVSCLYETLDGTPLTTEALRSEIRRTRPLSVVMGEKVDALREWAKGRTVPA
ncbi:MAG: ATPase, partial [Planctomycetes bacterium]|nr:ATPase [Planctomycetota bacterium]